MNNKNVRFRAGPLPEDFIQVLAKFGHTTVSKIKQMVANCILCEQDAAFAVLGIDQNWRGVGTFKFILSGLCESCSLLPDRLAKVAIALNDSPALVC
jgi:hypothetical protein